MMRRRTAIGALLAVAITLVTLLAPSTSLAWNAPAMNLQVRRLILKYGPVVTLHPDEQYMLDRPAVVLNGPSTLVWGLVENENDPAQLKVTVLGSKETSSTSILHDEAIARSDPHASDPNFRYWIESDSSLWDGNLARAMSYVMVSSPADDENTLDVQFWLYYAYNGPVKVRATLQAQGSTVASQDFALKNVGTHQGDWEQVTLRFSRANTNASWSLDKIYLSQHSGGEWVSADQFSYRGTHPIIYSALDSHANYATTGTHPSNQPILTQDLGSGISASVYQLDYTGNGQAFAAYYPWNYEIVSSDVQGMSMVYAPKWFSYDGLWGPYAANLDTANIVVPELGIDVSYPYAQVDKGPVGPAQHAPIPAP